VRILFILNDPPYGDERLFNALRLVLALLKRTPGDQVSCFLLANAVGAAVPGQKPPEGYYNLERMLKRLVAAGSRVLLCGTCMAARGLDQATFVEGARRSTMDELAAETAEADKVLVF
jgi:uncharacterized protein involved in oxidation of intracellular sulfur